MLDGVLFDKLVSLTWRRILLDLQGLGIHCPRSTRFGVSFWWYTGIISPTLCFLSEIVQLVISGDFLQLPPVPETSHEHRMPATYAFDAKSWPRCMGRPIVLSRVFRQRDNGSCPKGSFKNPFLISHSN
jgi:hypothetical protein